MSPSVFTKMRQDKERVLINLIWVLWRVSSFCRKCKFSDAIVKLLTRLTRLNSLVLVGGRNLFWDRCPNILRANKIWLFASLACIIFGLGPSVLRLSISLMHSVVFGWLFRSRLNLHKLSFNLIRIILLIFNSLPISDILHVIWLNSVIVVEGGISFGLVILTWCWWLPSAPVPLLANCHSILSRDSLWPLVRSKWPHMLLLICFISSNCLSIFRYRLFWINAVLHILKRVWRGGDRWASTWCPKKVLLTVLVSSSYSIELFSVVGHIILSWVMVAVDGLIITIQILLIHLLVIEVCVLLLWWRIVTTSSLHLSIRLLLRGIDHLWEVSLSSNLLSVIYLLWCLVLRWLVCVVFW